MTQQLQFQVNWEHGASGEQEERLTHASLGIVANERAITHVEDLLAKTTRDMIRVSAYPLALWLASNWWRLRWEVPSPEQRDDWSMAHHLAAAGSGYVWPNLTIESHGDHIRLSSRETSSANSASIAYLRNIDLSLPASEFVSAVDEFIDTVIARLCTRGIEDSFLQKVWELVRTERQDPQRSQYRRMEALLGFDAEKGPGSQIDQLIEAGTRLGTEAVAEVAASAVDMPQLKDTEQALEDADCMAIEDFGALRSHVGQDADFDYPWERGEVAACRLRSALGQKDGPLQDELFADWLSLPAQALQSSSGEKRPMAAALRQDAASEEVRILFRSNWRSGRRFEMARLIGEHFVSAPHEDRLMPATNTKTARQSTQRAFAAEFLLPFDDLKAQIGRTPEDEDRIEDIAADYGVSPLLVRTRLVNKGLLEQTL